MISLTLGYVLLVTLSIGVVYALHKLYTRPKSNERMLLHSVTRNIIPYVSSIFYGIGVFLCLLPILLIGWYISMSANNAYWFSIAPWPFSAFSSFGEQVVLYVLSLGLGVGFTIVGMSIYKLDKMKDQISPANIPFVSVLRGVGALSIIYPLLIELYLEWLYSLPAESDGPYSLAFSNLLKGPFPMSWFASGKFLLAMYMSAVLFGIVLVVIAEIIRKKSNTSST